MDLTLVPLQDLYQEILNRFDHAVIIGMKVLPTENKISRRWKGDHHMASGMATDISVMIIKDWYDRQTIIDTEDL